MVFYNSESSFRSAAVIDSIENFDAYAQTYGFVTPVIALDGVSYSATSCTNRCWTFDGGNYVSPPNSLLSNDIAPNTLSFGSGRYVNALGFWLSGLYGTIGYPSLGWEIVVKERNGSSTVIEIPTGVYSRYFGITSESGIDSLVVRDNPLDGGAGNWWFDDVARGAIIGGAPLADSIPVPPPSLGGPDYWIGAVPEPSTYALFAVGLLMLAFRVKRRPS